MMKFVSKLILANVLCLSSLPTSAAEGTTNPWAATTADIARYLLNLGQYYGFNLNNPVLTLANLTTLTTNQLTTGYAFDALFGSIPVNFTVSDLSRFVPDGSANDDLNDLANNTFKSYQSGGTSDNGNVGAVDAIDQPTSTPPASGGGTYMPGLIKNTQSAQSNYLNDPVSQAIFNILGTPDYSQCTTTDSNNNEVWNSSCTYKYQNLVTQNVIGDPTKYNQPDYFSYSFNEPIIPQLNGNTLISPLMYSTTQGDIPTQSSGLTAKNQAQEAANFIRYASGQVTPVTLPNSSDFSRLYFDAISTDTSAAGVTKSKQALATLNNYFASLRVYAAQTSVGLSNLYYIMSRRMPQTVNSKNTNITPSKNSEAQVEFTLATWRLYNPSGSNPSPVGSSSTMGGSPSPSGSSSQQNDDPCTSSTNWVSCINTSTTPRVQKEIAILLAEINYQMYLDRQIQERILMTNSILLLQNMKSSQPSAPSYGDASTNGSTGN
ncbi:type IVB secretion system protein IcmX [Legionella waltersii]|uniref:IcmX (IcmY) n=1 Tax=Legionella waltersii TaxID=66969 RepID=A0A0W1AD96_9GAMM|nr:type IVB secretion system protein IcmX [Legionella waltersii]KTD79287.1 IcmX (IcmY) [Legionella waltersii]SNV12901.1 IcmX (IcmY) [Legionella waltersii]